ncbi:Phosphotransferase enzyme family protein [Streptomyces sp. YIM 130001]|uniref:phosphotransferase n=1 Tax=Streptomyces sp. YIM 130001 TaxID=2259644 RepID=UPI000E6557B4|nr:phosphotransferase [Streptomyces sp. YIM 130001]RII09212.1 Phosphotransferase enzyme family protein [Streptomyces sp. YIM 130001]
MLVDEVRQAVAGGTALARSLGLDVDDVVVLQNSNKLALRLLPCDVMARVAPAAQHVAEFEIDLAQRLTANGSPVAALEPRVEPRVYQRDGFAITFWTYYASTTADEVPPADYARALGRLHAGMRELDVRAPHFMERVEQARLVVSCPERSPALSDADRDLLVRTLRNVSRAIGERGAAEQLLHGEPHPGNLLPTTDDGLRFIDLETFCRGPVEFDLAHAPEAVGDHYPGVDRDLLRECRLLVLAIVTAWRWDRDDQLPNGTELGTQWLGQIREAFE